MRKGLIAGFTALILFLAADSLWLGVVAKNFYRQHLGEFLAPSFKLWPALIFYPLYLFGLTVFVLSPTLREGKGLTTVFLLAFLFGFIPYGTYNLTKMATMKS